MDMLNGVKVAILAANGFEQVEMVDPRQALDEAGAVTVLVSPEKEGRVQGWNHFNKGDFFPIDMTLDEANAADFDALLLPGGLINPDRLRLIPKAAEFVRAFHLANKPIAAICHGPWMLINAGVVKGCKLTSFPSIKIDMINAGAEWVDEAVVTDKGIITSRKPDDIPQFNDAMIKAFTKK